MLYKVTPTLAPAEAPAPKVEGKKTRGPRKRRKSAVYDADGNEVLVSLTCLKCRQLKPLAQFGLRKMGDGAIRNQPWCRGCRSGAGTKGKKPEVAETLVPEAVSAPVTGPSAAPVAAAQAAAAPHPSAAPVAQAAAASMARAVAAPVVQASTPLVELPPVPAEPVSPWMAAIASLRAVVSRPVTPGSPDEPGPDDSKR